MASSASPIFSLPTAPELKIKNCCFQSGYEEALAKKRVCPLNGIAYNEVPARTIAYHIKDAWDWRPTSGRYYFCDDPECDVVYFGEDGSTLVKSQLRTRVGVKEACDDGLLCYCFGVTTGDFQRHGVTRDYVMAQTKAGLCSCATGNPSGRCCLKDFPKSEA